MAQEHNYPAVNDDGLAAYRWLIASGVAAKHIIIVGILLVAAWCL